MLVLKPHISLNVTNVEASVAFYEKLFGVKAFKRRPGYAKFDLAVPSLNLAMMEAPPTGLNVNHFGIQVASTDDVLEAKARFEKAGLDVVTEEQVACCHAVQDKVWVADPDGNEWEVFVVLADIPEDANRGSTSAVGCCPTDASASMGGSCATGSVDSTGASDVKGASGAKGASCGPKVSKVALGEKTKAAVGGASTALAEASGSATAVAEDAPSACCSVTTG